MKVEYNDVAGAIATGICDENLSELIGLIRDRQDKMARKLAFQIRVGNTVELHNLRPANLNGQKAKVLKLNRTTVTARLEQDADKPYAPTHRIPLACCKLVP